MRGFGFKALLTMVFFAPLGAAQTTETKPAEVVPPAREADAQGGNPSKYYGGADLILWWMKGQALPALVTSSPSGTPSNQAGVPGTPGFSTLYGLSNVNNSLRSGGKFNAGVWVDEENNLGFEADFLFLESKASRYLAESGGDPILARPFTDAQSGIPASIRVAFPGDLAGSIAVQTESGGLVGGGISMRQNISSMQTESFRLEGIAGYRAMTFTETISISQSMVSINPNNPNFVAVGTRIDSFDRFLTSNTFNGFEIGLAGKIFRGPLTILLDGRMALGMNHNSADVYGSTTATVPGVAPVTSLGGLYALSSNIGSHGHQSVSILPQLTTKVAYQFTDMVNLSFGYNLLVWSSVSRAGGDIDQTVNPNLLPGSSLLGGPIRPGFGFEQNTFWAQGFSLGMEVNY